LSGSEIFDEGWSEDDVLNGFGDPTRVWATQCTSCMLLEKAAIGDDLRGNGPLGCGRAFFSTSKSVKLGQRKL
jgi:hypothetical protein